MRDLRNYAVGFLAFVVVLLGGCGGGGSSQVSITLTTPDGVLSIDESEANFSPTLTVTAAVGGDTKNQGVTWDLKKQSSCSGTGTGSGQCGTLTNNTPFTVTYTPPSNLSATLAVTLTATAVADTSVTKTASISVVLPPTFTLTNCNPPSPPAGTACVLPSGQNGVAYSSNTSNTSRIAFTGGVAPYQVTVSSYTTPLTLPQLCLGITTSTTTMTASISGTPCGSGTTTFNVTVQDNTNSPSAGAPPVSQLFSITIQPASTLTLQTTSLPAATTNVAYNTSLVAVGGVPPYTWTLSPPPGTSLPPGIAFNTSTGVFSGVATAAALTGSSCSPAVAGKYCFTVQVTDSTLPTHQTAPAAPLPLSITVQAPPPLQITTPSPLPNGTTATGYNTNLQATGGIAPYTWSVVGGQLPAGLILTSTGDIIGTPVMTGTSNFTVQVADSEVSPATRTTPFQITVVANANPSSNNALLQGSYAYLFRGFDKDGMVMIAGTVTADGKGHFTSGQQDSNRNSGVAGGGLGPEAVSGTYAIGGGVGPPHREHPVRDRVGRPRDNGIPGAVRESGVADAGL